MVETSTDWTGQSCEAGMREKSAEFAARGSRVLPSDRGSVGGSCCGDDGFHLRIRVGRGASRAVGQAAGRAAGQVAGRAAGQVAGFSA
ncbi:hypothetical protein [Protofrankia symbiont of Coriaria ruscifolia]|uniref:hypothetical protein n=1 Tax=Protofrankia symbiont of Coriaria ruscifolia TaxID=1306542 RepID=UPI0010416D2C|nr:hypothetical protein [Protofrankia symbiont of Coriaria ruscifolia]